MIVFSSLTYIYRLEYNKKPGKPAVIKTMKDPSIARDDLYKSGTIHTGPGEPANSQSKPTPRGKQIAAKPITTGKLLRPGGPGGAPSKLASRPAPQSRPVQSRPVPTPAAANNRFPSASDSRPVPQPLAALNGSAHNRQQSGSSMRAPPPPPPAPAPVAQDPTCKALYDFAGQGAGEMSVTKGDVIIIVRKETNGKLTPIICIIENNYTGQANVTNRLVVSKTKG
jgi:myosin-1